MRTHINKNLIYTTSDSDSKRNYATKNQTPIERKRIFIMTVFGKEKQISHSEYEMLKNAGYNVTSKII